MLHLTALNDHIVSGPAGVALAAGTAFVPRQSGPSPASSIQKRSMHHSTLSSEGDMCGISSFAFQGTNAHLLVSSLGEGTVGDPASHGAAFKRRAEPPPPLLDHEGDMGKGKGSPSSSPHTPSIWFKTFTSVLPPAHSLLRRVRAVPRSSAASPPSSLQPHVDRRAHLTAPSVEEDAVVVFEADLGHPSSGWLRDHVVGGKVLVPGAAFLEAALSAAHMLSSLPEGSLSSQRTNRQQGGPGGSPPADAASPPPLSLALSEVSFLSPLVLPSFGSTDPVRSRSTDPVRSMDPPVTLMVTVSPTSGTFKVSSRLGTGSGATVSLHARGTFSALVGQGCPSNAAIDTVARPTDSLTGTNIKRPEGKRGGIDAVRAHNTQPRASARLYADLAAAGLQYGPAFRGLRCINSSFVPYQSAEAATAPTEEASARVITPPAGGPRCSFLVHPASLDSAFQLGAVVGGAATSSSSKGTTTTSGSGTTYVPAHVSLFYAARSPLQGGGSTVTSHPISDLGQLEIEEEDLIATACVAAPPHHGRGGGGGPLSSLGGSKPLPKKALHRDFTLSTISGALIALVVGLESRLITDGSGRARQAAARTGGSSSSQAPAASPGHKHGISREADEEEEARAVCMYEVQWQVDEAQPCLDHSPLKTAFHPAPHATVRLLTEGTKGQSDGGINQMLSEALKLAQGAARQPAANAMSLLFSGDSKSSLSSCTPLGSSSEMVHGLFRSVGREVPGLEISSVRSDPQRPPDLDLDPYGSYSHRPSTGCQITLGSTGSDLSSTAASSASNSQSPYDGYGDEVSAGALLRPRLLRPLAASSSPAPYQMVPHPRGSLTSLVPVPLLLTDQPLALGTVLLLVKAVGINFRDVLNVRVMIWYRFSVRSGRGIHLNYEL